MVSRWRNVAEPSCFLNYFLNLVISYWILVVQLACYERFRDILVTLYNLQVFFRFPLYYPMIFIMFEIQDLFYSNGDGWFHLLNCGSINKYPLFCSVLFFFLNMFQPKRWKATCKRKLSSTMIYWSFRHCETA